MSQSHDLHRALLRPFILTTLRAAGFHSTRPSVLDTLLNLFERHLLLLASTTLRNAEAAHNDPIPTLSDVRLALQECGVLVPVEGAAEEGWREVMREAVGVLGAREGAERRAGAEKRRREGRDGGDVGGFVRWVEGPEVAEMRRVAGYAAPSSSAAVAAAAAAAAALEGGSGTAAATGKTSDTTTTTAPAVGVGGSIVQEDFFTTLKRRKGVGKSAGMLEEERWAGTVLGTTDRPAEDETEMNVEGGPVGRVADWRPTALLVAGTKGEG